MREPRIPARRRANRPAVERQRVRQHRDPPRGDVRLHHLVGEHQRRRPAAALVARPLLAPLGGVHVDGELRTASHGHRFAEGQRHPEGLAEAVGGVITRLGRHRNAGHRRGSAAPARRDLPVHLVVRVVLQSRMGERRVLPGGQRGLDRAAIEFQRVRQHRDTISRDVRLRHRPGELQRPRATAALVVRPLLVPGTGAEVDLHPWRPGHRHRLAEGQPDPDRVAQAVGGVAARVRRHLHPRHRRRPGDVVQFNASCSPVPNMAYRPVPNWGPHRVASKVLEPRGGGVGGRYVPKFVSRHACSRR